MKEFQGRESKMSIMEWAGSGKKAKLPVQGKVNRDEIQLSTNGLSAKDPLSLLDIPRVRTRPSSMSSVSWGDIGYESSNSDPVLSQPISPCEQQSTGPWTSLIQSMGKSKKEKQLRRTADKITIQVLPPDPSEHTEEYDLDTFREEARKVCIHKSLNEN
jgi:hypothetical protein